MEIDPTTTDPAMLAQMIALAGVGVLCVGGSLLLVGMLLIGLRILRREGEKQVSVPQAVRRGAKTMTLFFVRKEGVTEAWTDPGSDDDRVG